MRPYRWTISLLLLAGMLESSCQRRRPNFTPPPALRPQPAASQAPVQLPQPPEIQPEPSQPLTTLPVSPEETIPGPPAAQPQPPQRSRRIPADTRVQPSPTEAPNPAPSSPEPLRLGPMTTPEQERDLNSQIDQALARAVSNLGAIGNRRLTKDQQSAVAQVQSFVRQARELRKTDLAAARSLAQRADILARDLLGSLR